MGPVRIEANAFGYAEWARDYAELPDSPVRILLAPEPIVLDSLGVKAGGRAGDPISVSRDAFVVDPAMIRAIPTVLENDVLRALAISPSAPSDFVSVPYVCGGTSEGTPVMLDGVRLFNPFHLGGFLSAVNAEAVDHVALKLMPGAGAGTQYIGSLSGAIEIGTRDGARDRHTVAGAVGLASLQATVEGPLGGSMSYLVDGRPGPHSGGRLRPPRHWHRYVTVERGPAAQAVSNRSTMRRMSATSRQLRAAAATVRRRSGCGARGGTPTDEPGSTCETSPSSRTGPRRRKRPARSSVTL